MFAGGPLGGVGMQRGTLDGTPFANSNPGTNIITGTSSRDPFNAAQFNNNLPPPQQTPPPGQTPHAPDVIAQFHPDPQAQGTPNSINTLAQGVPLNQVAPQATNTNPLRCSICSPTAAMTVCLASLPSTALIAKPTG